MPVTPDHANLLQNRHELSQFLAACQQNLTEKKPQKIVSISVKIPAVDPLVVLRTIAEPEQVNFYIEQPKKKEAITAIGSVLKLEVTGEKRFSKVQNFINSCLPNIINIGDLDLPFAGSRFFCSFTFFEDNLHSHATFPAATVFLPRWQVTNQNDCCVIVANVVIEPDTNIEKTSEFLFDKITLITSLGIKNYINIVNQKPIFNNSAIFNKNKFRESVFSAINSIRSHQINKVVLAQALDVIGLKSFNVIDSLNNLRRLHQDCYIFAVSNGQKKTFIGASPERLIVIKNQQLETDALAGSAPRGKNEVEDAYFADLLLRSEKERIEHLAVSDFITQRLSDMGMNPEKLPMPCLLQLSNIQHLWTPIRARVPNGIEPLEILAELHPTPAVAGLPRDIACQEIRRYETFDRSLYAAPLGWIDYRGNSEFIVGIRSALIDDCRARLYAGAGIVAGSNPDKELNEIELKLQALMKALV